MPIYMDRHDVSETVTAEVIAEIHQADLKIQDQFGCRGLTYWFDDKRKTAFCLIEAANAKAIHDMHKQAHGQVPHSVIEVDPNIVESFLGRIEDPEKAKDTRLNIINDPAFRTIMVIALSPLTPKRNGMPLRSSSNDYSDCVVEVLASHDGSLVKQTGDQFLASFKSVSKAVDAALEIQSKLKKDTHDNVLVKIGLAAGSPVTKKQLIFEDTIKLAERMCKIIKGEIIVSSEVKDLYKSENSNAFVKARNVSSLSHDDEEFLNHFSEFIESAWTNADLKVDDFSKPMGYSKSQLYRRITFLAGKSLNAVVKEYRLSEALKLLNKRSGNISEIAFETGFTSPSYFCKCFQKRYGYSPSDYLPTLAD